MLCPKPCYKIATQKKPEDYHLEVNVKDSDEMQKPMLNQENYDNEG